MARCPILLYHWFRADGAASASRSPQLEITPELFDRQMALLKRAGYRPVPLGEALGPDRGGTRPRRRIAITFDDGTLDFWEHARPILGRYGFTATVFVVSGQVGGLSTWDRDVGEPDRPLMSWDQIRELHGAGYEIGSHTHTHRPLTGLSDDEARAELDRSRRTLERELSLAPRMLAYPRGLHSERHRELARETGYSGACAVALHWRDLWRSDRYALRRMPVKGTESLLAFRLRLGLGKLVRHADDGVAGGDRGQA
jgi:peptidoglycan/xylan/chitin deacetylase (PgdA/CDA1 family)